jgi:hypothetical protein
MTLSSIYPFSINSSPKTCTGSITQIEDLCNISAWKLELFPGADGKAGFFISGDFVM